MKEQKGQAFVENLIVHIVLFMAFLAVLEVCRLIAFKSCLNAVVFDIAEQISYSHLSLKRANIIPAEKINIYLKNKKFEDEIAKQISQALNKVMTSLLSFDFRKEDFVHNVLSLNNHNVRVYVRFVNETDRNDLASGIYLKVNTCLPVLFSSYFRLFSIKNNNSANIGLQVDMDKNLDSNRDCLGELFSQNPLMPVFWFRVRAAVFMPWPATTQIFEKGFPFANKIYGLETENRKVISKMLSETDLSLFLKEKANE